MIDMSNFDDKNIEYLLEKIEKEKNDKNFKNNQYRLIESSTNLSGNVIISEKSRKIAADTLINSR